MTEAYRHDEIAKLADELWERRGPARSVRLKLIGTRRKVLWVCGIRKSSSRS
jgi:hypothetical protein